MAKIRDITDKTWRLFEKGRIGKKKIRIEDEKEIAITSDEYLEYLLCNQSNNELLQALKSDLRECIDKYGNLSSANKDLKRKIKELKAQLKEIKSKEIIDIIEE